MANFNRYHRTCKLQDPCIERVRVADQNQYVVWMDQQIIEVFKSRQSANKLVKLLNKLNEEDS